MAAKYLAAVVKVTLGGDYSMKRQKPRRWTRHCSSIRDPETGQPEMTGGRMKRLALVFLVFTAVACGQSSPTAPTAPSRSVAVTQSIGSFATSIQPIVLLGDSRLRPMPHWCQ
jgi:hypothetical protein